MWKITLFNRRFFALASSGAIISAIADLFLRSLVMPIFGIPYTYQILLYPIMGLCIGFTTIFVLAFLLNEKVGTFRFTALAPILGAILMPLLRIYLFPLFGIDSALPVLDYVLIGGWDMMITTYLLKFVDIGPDTKASSSVK